MKKRIRKIIALSLCLSLILLLSPHGLAAGEIYVIEEMGVKLMMPSGYSTITRDTPANDPVFALWGYTYDELMSFFTERAIYLNGSSMEYNEEIVVTMVEDTLTDLNMYRDEVITSMASAMVEEYEAMGVALTNYELYGHPQGKFLKIYFTDEVNGAYGLQFYTIYDSKAMNFTLRSYEGEITERQEGLMKALIDSITFSGKTPETAYAFRYTDGETGVSFTVPENWKTQKDLGIGADIVDACFVSTRDLTAIMMFGTMDLWEQIPVHDRVGYSREDIDNSIMTPEEISEMYLGSLNQVTMITYNNREYFQYEGLVSPEASGLDITMYTVTLIHIDKGWMYYYAYFGDKDDPRYSDFQSLIHSIAYGSPSSDQSNEAVPDQSPRSLGIIVLLVLLSLVALALGGTIVILIVILVRRRKKLLQAPTVPNTPGQTCSHCGKPLPPNGIFCNDCGSRTDVQPPT